MIDSTKIKRFITGLLLITASQFIAVNASATASIFGAGIGKGIALTSCQTCHNSASGSESKGNLKPNIQNAYNLDKTGLTRLKNVINGCTSGQTLSPSTYACATPVVTPVSCTAPLQVRDAATNTCVAAPAVSCIAPLVRNAATNTCVTPPPVSCSTPQVRDAATNTCVAAPAVSCIAPLVRNAATNTCVTAPVVTPPVPSKGDDNESDDDNEDNHHGKHNKNEQSNIHSGSVGKNTSGAAKTDSFQVTCAKGTKSLAVSVRDLNPRKDPVLSIQAFKGKASTPLSTDKVDGDAKFSRIENLAAGAGTYTITVNKSSSKEKGSETYSTKLSCKNANGSTATSMLKTLKDQ